MNTFDLGIFLRIFPVRQGICRGLYSMMHGTPQPLLERSRERRTGDRAQPRNRPRRDEEERRDPRRLAARQRDQLALSADEGRAIIAARRGAPRRTRLLRRRPGGGGAGAAADPDPEHRDDGIWRLAARLASS